MQTSRKDFASMNPAKRKDVLTGVYSANGVGADCVFPITFAGTQIATVCRDTYIFLYGISDSMNREAKFRARGGIKEKGVRALKDQTASNFAVCWMHDYFELTGDRDPTHCHQVFVGRLSIKETMYPKYKTEMENINMPIVIIKPSTFR